jgi:1-aminocyclopropane-1-carboxylate deaminase
MKIFQIPSPVTKLNSDFLKKYGVTIYLKRDDLIHPEVSGNKWRKLKYNFEEANKLGLSQVLTFGGAYSNHIAATAAAGNHFGIKTIGVIRGEEGFENDTLNKAQENGMQLHFISREAYRRKSSLEFIDQLIMKHGNSYIIQEGGANELGVKGCEEIIQECQEKFDLVACAAGTGTTVSGICRQLKNQQLLVFPALKRGGGILDEMKKYCSEEMIDKVELQLDYHFGGYAKTKPELIAFYHQFLKDYNIELDLVYTSKMMFGLFDMIQKEQLVRGTKIMVIHTGGVQGNKGMLTKI